MPCRKRPESSIAASSVAHAFVGKLESEFYNRDVSVFAAQCPAMAFFSMCTVRLDVSSGSKALGESNLQIKLRRVAHLLMQTALCIRTNGMVAYSASPASGIPHTSGWLNAHATLQIEPSLCDYAALAMMASADFQSGNQSVHKLTNDVCLDVDELLGTPGKSAARLMGKYSAMACDPWDAAKFERTYIVPLAFF